jgi:transposase
MRQNGRRPFVNIEVKGLGMNISMLGIDVAKNVFQLHGVDKSGKNILKKRLMRRELLSFIAKLSPCTIAMEACSGSNYWSRQFKLRGHEVKLISPQYVKPFVKTNKTDANDAQAICEASLRPSMYFVPTKSIEQQDIQSLHRIRERLINSRTRLVNQTRGILAEYGIVIPKGIYQLHKELPIILEDAENELTMMAREFLSELKDELSELDEKIKGYNEKLDTVFRNNDLCKKISKIEGVGPIIATAMVSSVGDVTVFKNGRQMSAWLGLVPRQNSSGDKKMLFGISKRGDSYLRKLLIHGSRSVVHRAKNKTDRRSCWINDLVARRGSNKACVAVANKNVRLICAVMKKKGEYMADELYLSRNKI